MIHTIYPKKYAHGFCFAVLCCGYTLTDFPISIRLTSLALWQSNDCPSASKATLMNMDKYFMSIHYERLHNHNKAKHNKTVCIFLGIYCISETDPGPDSGRPLHSSIWVGNLLYSRLSVLHAIIFNYRNMKMHGNIRDIDPPNLIRILKCSRHKPFFVWCGQYNTILYIRWHW